MIGINQSTEKRKTLIKSWCEQCDHDQCCNPQGRGGRGGGRGHQQGGVRQERHEEQVHLQHAQGVGLILWHSVYFNIK